MTETLCERLAHILILGQEIPCGIEQIVEVEQCGGALVLAPVQQELPHCLDDASEQLARHHRRECVEGIMAGIVVRKAGVEGHAAIALAFTRGRGSLLPCAFGSQLPLSLRPP